MTVSVSDVLIRAAALLDKGVCRGANARLAGGKACGVFDTRAAAYSMYGALCAVLGPGLGDDKELQASAAWKLIRLRVWGWGVINQGGGRMEHALHDLNDWLPASDLKAGDILTRASTVRGDLFRAWAANPEIKAMGEWR